MDVPIDKRFAILVEISRAQHFAWREAVTQLCPDVDPTAVVERLWEVTGVQTAQAYLKHLDPEAPLAPQFARNIVWSSLCMGEDAVAEVSDDGEEAFVRHAACPWQRWHERTGLVAEDRPGCDAWFRSAIATINDALGTKLCFETLSSLPEGGGSCVRRLWVERG